MSYVSSTVAGGDDALATQYNNLRKDSIENAGDYASSTGSANAYALSIDAVVSAYAEKQVFKFKANFANTGPATLNVNTIGALAMKHPNGNDVRAGDIISGQVVVVVHNGTDFTMISEPATPHTLFGGDGSDGALNVTSGTTTIDLGGEQVVVKNYTSINIESGATVDFSNPATGGTIIFFKSQGNVTIEGTLDATGVGAGPNEASNLQITETDHSGEDGDNGEGSGSGDPDGANGTDATGGSQLDYYELLMLTDDEVYKFERKSLQFETSAGVGEPTAGTSGGTGGGSNPGGAGGAAGVSGVNGGLLFIECAGALDFTGLIDVSGTDGTDGSDGTQGDGDGNETAGGGGGGGGAGGTGGNGGYAIILYNVLIADSGTIDSSGGDGGDGGDGADGGDGRSTGTNGGIAGGGGGGGGAGSCPGTKDAAGADGQGGRGGEGSTNTNGGHGGSGGSGGSGGTGGGTFFGGAGTIGTIGTQGARGNGTRPSLGAAGGPGGAGGSGVASIGGLITKNKWF